MSVRPKQVSNLASFDAATTDEKGCFGERVVSEQRQEPDGIKYVGLSHSVWASDTGVWGEVNSEADKVLEAVNLKAGNQFILLRVVGRWGT